MMSKKKVDSSVTSKEEEEMVARLAAGETDRRADRDRHPCQHAQGRMGCDQPYAKNVRCLHSAHCHLEDKDYGVRLAKVLGLRAVLL